MYVIMRVVWHANMFVFSSANEIVCALIIKEFFLLVIDAGFSNGFDKAMNEFFLDNSYIRNIIYLIGSLIGCKPFLRDFLKTYIIKIFYNRMR